MLLPSLHTTMLHGKALLFFILMDKRHVFLWIPYVFKAKGGKVLSPSSTLPLLAFGSLFLDVWHLNIYCVQGTALLSTFHPLS